MKKKLFVILAATLFLLPIISTAENITITKPMKESFRIPGPLIPPFINTDPKITNDGPDPGFFETSEFMLGSVAVAGIFLESNGAIDPDTEIWAPHEELNVQMEIAYALTQWWETQNPDANLDFTLKWYTSTPTSYEPIIHPSAITDNTYEKLWVNEAMSHFGYTTGDWMQRTRAFTNDLRDNEQTDWAFTIFIIDSTNDAMNDPSSPGSFSDGYNAYAYTGGPFCVLTYDNGLWGIANMHKVCAHETAHIFWATEEYNHQVEFSGYLNAKDNDGSGCLMDTNALCLSAGTKNQIGWRDTDADTIPDVLDTNPNTDIYAYSPDPTSATTLTYTGIATVVPLQNQNPCPWNSGNDVTLNTLSQVKYKLDSGAWNDATPTDGSFDSTSEDFNLTISGLTVGTHTITVKAINSVGNEDLTPAIDTVTIIAGNTKPNTPDAPDGEDQGKANTEYTYTASTTDPESDQLYYLFDWGDGTDSGWIGPHDSGDTVSASHSWTSRDRYEIKVCAKDEHELISDWSDPLSISMAKTKEKSSMLLPAFLQNFIDWAQLMERIIAQFF